MNTSQENITKLGKISNYYLRPFDIGSCSALLLVLGEMNSDGDFSSHSLVLRYIKP